MNQFSDSESLDSEDGIRFKTDSTRNKTENRRPVGRHSHSSTSDSYRHRRHRSPSPRRSHKSKRHKSQRRSRSNERDRRKKSRSRDRSPHQKRYKRYNERKNVEKDRVSKPEVLSHKVVHDSSSSDESSFGPQLPEKHEHSSTISDSNNKKVDSSRDKLSPKKVDPDKSEDITGSKLPQHLTKVDKDTCGPKLPPFLQKEKSNISSLPQKDNTPAEFCGPKILAPVKKDNPEEIIAIEDDTNKEVSDPKIPTVSQREILEEISYPELPSQIIKENTNEEIVGPKLPPHIQEENEGIVGPKIPPQIQEHIVGPQLPPHLQKNKLSENNSKASDSHSTNDIGPSLPPLKNCNYNEEKQCIGPTLPPHLRKQLEEASLELNDEEGEEEDDCYGPLPPEMMATSQAHRALEERALQIKLDKLDDTGEVKTVREEWMIELPTVQAANLGLGPRQFRAKAGPDLSDRSSWTNTPEDKEKGPKQKEVDLRKEAEMMEMYKRDQEQEKMIKKHKKKKKEKSLLEQHQDKLKKNKKKEEEEGGNVRRPFDRDIDLKVNQFDDAQKKAIMKKAQLLDDRFSKGQSKFL